MEMHICLTSVFQLKLLSNNNYRNNIYNIGISRNNIKNKCDYD